MKTIIKGIFMLSIITTFSCKMETKTNTSTSKDFVENVVTFIIHHKDNRSIELPFIYDSLVSKIPQDNSESLMLAESLKKRGFKVIKWGRGNFSRGPRIVTLVLQKEDCICQVDKIYYSNSFGNSFEVAERIKCSDSLTNTNESIKENF